MVTHPQKDSFESLAAVTNTLTALVEAWVTVQTSDRSAVDSLVRVLLNKACHALSKAESREAVFGPIKPILALLANVLGT